MGRETSHCPSETCGARTSPPPPQRFLKESMAGSFATDFDIFWLSMDGELDELGDGLEDLEIYIDVEFVSYATHVRLSGEYKILEVGNLALRLQYR